MENNEIEEQDFDTFRENVKLENLTCDYYPNLTTNSSVEKLINQYLEESLEKKMSKETIQCHFYIACFWGIRDALNAYMEKFPSIDLNYKNSGTKWTPLHAAAFQEHGPIVMSLLEKGADLLSEDKYARTPLDFASASEIIWPLFAPYKCNRLSKNQLAEKQVYSKTQIMNRINGFSYFNQIKLAPYQISKNHMVHNDNFNIASSNGDVLANDASNSDENFLSSSNSNINFNLWK